MNKTQNSHQTVRIWKKTHRQLKIIAATQGLSLVEFLDRIAQKELQRMKEEENK